jgi:type I restriction enzyme S subunit
VLDQVDALRAKRHEAIALLDLLARSIFTSLVGDVIKNDRGWNDGRTLGDVAEIVSGITKGRKLPAGTMRVVPYLAVANVQAMRLEMAEVKTIDATKAEIKRYALMRNDLVLTEGGDPDKLGRGTLWREELPECIHQNHIFRVRLRPDSEIVPLYLNWLIASERGRRYFLKSAKQTTGIASINATQLREFPLLEPPPDLQRSLADQLVQVDAVKRTHTAHLAELDALFASVQDRAFRGELFADGSPAPELSTH